MDLLITGAAGFLGSHFLFEWLRQHPNDRALCLVRGTQEESPWERVNQALAQAAYECDSDIGASDLLDRITVIEADLNDMKWRNDPEFCDWITRSEGFEVVHGAANLSFHEEDRSQIWYTNVTGTTNFFRTLKGVPSFRYFNYISTAYVAGNREGAILESQDERPTSFNNVYEESKWAAEQVVRDIAAKQGVGIRIFRPSSIIGHSKTFRVSAKTGFYKVVEALRQVSRLRPAHTAAIEIPVKHGASLNLIPVDLVVLEMVDVIAAGAKSAGHVFHLTNERPVSLADLFFGISPMTGVRLTCAAEVRSTALDQMSALVISGLRHYLPYFQYARTFERKNVHACGAARHQQNYWLDLMRLREFVRAFIEDETRDAAQVMKMGA